MPKIESDRAVLPVVVETEAELEALPVGSVVRTRYRDAAAIYAKRMNGWHMTGFRYLFSTGQVAHNSISTVLFMGGVE